jgi:hypothetical protein
MTTTEEFKILQNSSLINLYKSSYDIVKFDDMMIEALIMKENNDYFSNLLEFVRQIKLTTEFQLREIKDFTDILRYLGIIDAKKNYISDYIYIINSIKDIIYMVDNEIDIVQFSRLQKLRKIKSNILQKN